jgi:hypothetical protein
MRSVRSVPCRCPRLAVRPQPRPPPGALPLHAGTESLQTRCWRKADSNFQSHHERNSCRRALRPFADSPLEERRFEPLVPLTTETVLRTRILTPRAEPHRASRLRLNDRKPMPLDRADGTVPCRLSAAESEIRTLGPSRKSRYLSQQARARRRGINSRQGDQAARQSSRGHGVSAPC